MRDDSEDGTMRAFSFRRRHQLPPNLFIRLWRRWMAAQADHKRERSSNAYSSARIPTRTRTCRSGALDGRSLRSTTSPTEDGRNGSTGEMSGGEPVKEAL